MFQLQHISYRVPERLLLEDLNLTLAPGQVCGLIGHNGSGKSTLLKLLTRQLTPSAGQISLNHKPLPAYGAREYARQVAYLPQHLPAATALTVRELVRMGRYAWRGLIGRHNHEDAAAVAQAFELTHTEPFADSMVDVLSGGERSRVWLAMCLAQQSPFLLLGEPLAALDIAHQIEVMTLVRQLVDRLGLGVVIVIHDINLAARYCDRLVALKHGRLLCDGTPEQMMNAEVLHDIYQINMHLIRHPHTGDAVALP